MGLCRMGIALHAAAICVLCLLSASAYCGSSSMGRRDGSCKGCGGGGGGAAGAGLGDFGSTNKGFLPRKYLRMQLRGGEGESASGEMVLERMSSSSTDGEDGSGAAPAGGGGAKSSGPEDEMANTVLDDTDVEGDSVMDDGENLSEEDEGENDVFVADPFEQPRPRAEKRLKPKSSGRDDVDEGKKERVAAAAAAQMEASAEEDDRSEGDEPFYNGVRVRNLFVDADTGTEAWCIGTVKYVRRSTGEYRIHFDDVPSWEPSKQVYWPAGDSDMKLAPDEYQEKTEEEVAELTVRMLQHCREAEWFQVRKLIFLGADATAKDDNPFALSPLHMACLSGEPDMVNPRPEN